MYSWDGEYKVDIQRLLMLLLLLLLQLPLRLPAMTLTDEGPAIVRSVRKGVPEERSTSLNLATATVAMVIARV